MTPSSAVPITSALHPLRHPVRFILLLCALVLVRGLVLMCVLPPLEGWDEYQHVGYVQFVQDHHKAPVYSKDPIPAKLLEAAAQLPQCKPIADQLKGYGARSFSQCWRDEPVTAPLLGQPFPLYQAQHPPVYYLLMSPIYRRAGGADHLVNAIGVLRLANLLLLVAATAVVLLAVRELAPDPVTRVWVSMAVALSPMMLLDCVRVANDSLAMLAAAGVVLCCACVATGTAIPAIVIGLLTAAAIWCKATNVALIPFAVICVWMGSSDRRLISRVLTIILLLAGVLAGIWPYLSENLAQHGVLIPAQESIVAKAHGKHFADYLSAARSINWLDEIAGWWTRGTLWIGGWSFIRAPKVLRTIYSLLILAGLLTWPIGIWLRRRHPEQRISTGASAAGLCLALLACFTASLAAHAVSSKVAWGDIFTNPWYAAPAIPCLIMLLVLGFRQIPSTTVAGALVLLIPVLYLLAELIGELGLMPVRYTELSVLSGGLTRLASLQPVWLGTPTLALSLLAELALLILVAKAAFPIRWPKLPISVAANAAEIELPDVPPDQLEA